jgi:KaiC/GvpD/RAD55 family RecA-like ATPase
MPLYDSRGVLQRIKWRWVEKKEGEQSFGAFRANDGVAPLFGMTATSGNSQLFITEGEIDAMSVKAMLPSVAAVSIPDGATSALKSIDAHLAWIKKFDVVYVCFDSDTAGNEAAEAVLTKYPEFKRVSIPAGYKDANECLQKGVGDLFKKATIAAKAQQPSYIEDWDTILTAVLEGIDNPMKDRGVDTGLYPLNELLGGWRAGETSCIFAPPGKGKSTMCRTLVYQQALQGKNCVVVSTEETAEDWVRNLTLIHSGGLLNRDTVKSVVELLSKHVTFVNHFTLTETDDLLNAIELTVRANDAFLVLFDNVTHYSKSNASDYWKVISALTNKLVSIATRYQCHILTIGHITKGAARAEEPNLADADGGNSLSQFCHNVIHIDRYKRKKQDDDEEGEEVYVPADPEMTTVLTLLKRRVNPISIDLPSVGTKTYLTYVNKSRTYLELTKVRGTSSVTPSKPIETPNESEQGNIPEDSQDLLESLTEGTSETAQPASGFQAVLATWEKQGKLVEPHPEVVASAVEQTVELSSRELEIIANARKEAEKDESTQEADTPTVKSSDPNDGEGQPDSEDGLTTRSSNASRIQQLLAKSRATKAAAQASKGGSNSTSKKSPADANKAQQQKQALRNGSASTQKAQPRLPASDKHGQEYYDRMQVRWKRAREAREADTRVVRNVVSCYQAGDIAKLPWESGQLPSSNSVITPTNTKVARLDAYQLLPPTSFRTTCMAESSN